VRGWEWGESAKVWLGVRALLALLDILPYLKQLAKCVRAVGQLL